VGHTCSSEHNDKRGCKQRGFLEVLAQAASHWLHACWCKGMPQRQPGLPTAFTCARGCAEEMHLQPDLRPAPMFKRSMPLHIPTHGGRTLTLYQCLFAVWMPLLAHQRVVSLREGWHVERVLAGPSLLKLQLLAQALALLSCALLRSSLRSRLQRSACTRGCPRCHSITMGAQAHMPMHPGMHTHTRVRMSSALGVDCCTLPTPTL